VPAARGCRYGKREAFPPARPAQSGRGQRPDPARAACPPLAGASPPPGRALACRWSRTCRSTGDRPARAGKTRVAFPGPARRGESTVTAAMAGAIAPAKSLHWHQGQPGAQSPRPAPAPPPAGALHPPGRALASVSPGHAALRGTAARGRGKRGSRFLFPPGLTKALSPLQWQGPSPLPQRHADPWPAWGQSPRPAPAPPPAGALHPPGRALAFCRSRTRRSTGHRRARAGERRVAFPDPACRAIPSPGPGRVSRQTSGRIACLRQPSNDPRHRGRGPAGSCGSGGDSMNANSMRAANPLGPNTPDPVSRWALLLLTAPIPPAPASPPGGKAAARGDGSLGTFLTRVT